jgi:subtilisin family serine protease
MILNCLIGGGTAVILYDKDDGMDPPTRSLFQMTAVHVKGNVGLALKNEAGRRVNVGFASSTEPEYTYSFFSGTSMATPHVAAAAAIVWSHFPECTNHQIRYALAMTAQDRGSAGCDYDYGYGIVKAKDAYDWLLQNDCSSANFGTSVSQGGCTTL